MTLRTYAWKLNPEAALDINQKEEDVKVVGQKDKIFLVLVTGACRELIRDDDEKKYRLWHIY